MRETSQGYRNIKESDLSSACQRLVWWACWSKAGGDEIRKWSAGERSMSHGIKLGRHLIRVVFLE